MPVIPIPRPIPNNAPIPRPFADPGRGVFNVPRRIPNPDSQLAPYNPSNNPGLPNRLPNNNGLPSSNYPDTPLPGYNLNPPVGNGRPNRTPTYDVPSRPVNPNPSPGRTTWREAVNRAVEDVWRMNQPNRVNYEEFFGDRPQNPIPEPTIDIPEPTIPTPSPRNSPLGVPRGKYTIKIEYEVHTQKFVVHLGTGEVIVNYTADVSSNFNAVEGRIVNPVELKQIATPPAASTQGTQKYFYWKIVATSFEINGVPIQGVDLGNGFKEFNIPEGISGIYTGYYDSFRSGLDSRGFEVTNKNLKISLRGENQSDPMPFVQRSTGNQVDTDEDEDNMRCRNCEAARVIRGLQRTITVDATTITSIPTGNLIVSPTIQKPVRVFCLPGTEDSIKQQFNLIDELRKRLAKTFNQSRMAKILARISQIMNFTQFWLTFHNALMMSADIGETFFGSIFQTLNNVAKIADDTPLGTFYDLDETPFDSQELITGKLEEWAKQIFGVQNWTEIKSKFAALNQIIRSTNTMIMNMRDLGESQRDLAEMSAERVGKLNNSLRKAGVIFDEGNWMSEDVNMRSRFLEKLEKIEESGVINTAVFFQSLSQQALDVQETKKEVAESKQKFQEDLNKGITTITGQATDAKTASQGAEISKEDIAK